MFNDMTSEALAVQYRALQSIGLAGRIAMTFELSDDFFREAFGKDRPPQ